MRLSLKFCYRLKLLACQLYTIRIKLSESFTSRFYYFSNERLTQYYLIV